jgi:MraZ protein
MTMFIGEHIHAIDDKGRVSVPAKFRKQLTGGLVVTRGLDACLWLFTREEWDKLAKKLAALPLSSSKSRAFARMMLAGAWDVELDSQGRIGLPEYLRTYAALKKHVAVAGLYTRIELWDEDAWQEYRAKTEQETESIAEAMSELGI